MNSLESIQRRFNRLKRQLVGQQKEQQRVERRLKIKSLRPGRSDEQRHSLTNKLNQLAPTIPEQGPKHDDQYRQLIDSVQDIIFKISPEGYFAFFNVMAENC